MITVLIRNVNGIIGYKLNCIKCMVVSVSIKYQGRLDALKIVASRTWGAETIILVK